MSGATFHDTFAAALTDAARRPPDGLSVGTGDDVARRFAVYRNNVIVSLVDALEERFPVTGRLVGGDFFRAMARAFVQVQPPTSPLLMYYGESFPEFIEAFPPAAPLPYLAGVARLESACTRAWHAADAEPFPGDALAGWSDGRLAAARLVLHPSAEVISESYAAGTIWLAHQGGATPHGLDPDTPEDILIARPGRDVTVTVMPPGGAAFVIALQEGATLGAAAVSAAQAVPAFDAAQVLATVIGAEVLVDVDETQEEERE